MAEEVGLYMIFEQGMTQEFDADLHTIIRGIYSLTESQAMEKAQQMVNRDGFNEWIEVKQEVEEEYTCKLCDAKRMEDRIVRRLKHVQDLHIVKLETNVDIFVDIDNNSTYVFVEICVDEDAQNHPEYKLYEKVMKKVVWVAK
jgi:hypothetical protein